MGEISKFVGGVTPVAEPKKKRTKKQKEYSVLVQDGQNLAILRPGRIKQTLVIVPSKGLYYIDREGEQPYSLNEDNLTRFMADAPDQGIELTGTTWITRLKRGRTEARDLLSFLDSYGDVIKSGFIRYKAGYYAWNDSVKSMYLADKKMFGYFMDRLMETFGYTQEELIAVMTDSPGEAWKRRTILGRFDECEYIKCVRSLFGIDNARTWIDAFVRGNMNMNMPVQAFVEVIRELYEEPALDKYITSRHTYRFSSRYSTAQEEEYPLDEICEALSNLSNRRNAQHVEFDSFLSYVQTYRREGYSELEQFMYRWADTLKLQKTVYKKRREKYIQYLESQHQSLSEKTSLMNSLQGKYASRDFTDFVRDAKYLEWEPDWGSYIWNIPHTVQELGDEQAQQQNCLWGWVPELANNVRHLVFMRNKKTPKQSQITIEVSKDGHIGEIAGFLNRPPNAEELKNIRRWAKEKQLVMPGEAAPPKKDENEKQSA